MTVRYRALRREQLASYATIGVGVTGLDENYLTYVVLDRAYDRVVSSHVSALAAKEQADALNSERMTT